jgi:hypothetical protein
MFMHLMNSLRSGIADVTAKIRMWEEVFKRDLKQAVGLQRQVRKKSERTKSKRR